MLAAETRLIKDKPYYAESWLRRLLTIRDLGYPELALGDCFKAEMLVDAMEDSSHALAHLSKLDTYTLEELRNDLLETMIVLFGYTNEIAPTMDYVKKGLATCPENPSDPELLKGAEDCWQRAKDMFVRTPPILAPIVKEFLSLPTRTCQLRKYYPGQNALHE